MKIINTEKQKLTFIQVFNYLRMSGAKMKPSLWFYDILKSNNVELPSRNNEAGLHQWNR